MLIVFLKS